MNEFLNFVLKLSDYETQTPFAYLSTGGPADVGPHGFLRQEESAEKAHHWVLQRGEPVQYHP